MPGQCRLGDYQAMGWKGRDGIRVCLEPFYLPTPRGRFPEGAGNLVILIEPDIDNNSRTSPFTEKYSLDTKVAHRRWVRSPIEFLEGGRSKQLDDLLARHPILQLLAILQCDGRPRRIGSQSRRSN